MSPNARSITPYMARLKVLIVLSVLVSTLADAQYVGGIGRGTVQSAAVPADCLNVPGGSALPGTVCDDGEVCTINDVYTPNCVCEGTFQDTDGDGTCDALDPCPELAILVNGNSCDDGDDCTANDVVTGCACAGIFQDTDGDGTCDADDPCPSVANAFPNDPCDDNSICTTNDVYNASCICTGTPVTQLGAIAGNWLLADGLPYVYSTAYQAGAVYQWSILPDPDGWVLIAQDSTVSVIAPPLNTQAQLCVSATQGNTCIIQTCTDLFVQDVSVPEAKVPGPGFTVRPNPSEGLFEVVFNGPVPGPLVFDVQDAFGRTVQRSSITRANSFIDLGSAAPGVYLLRATRDQGSHVVRLVVR